MENGRIDYKVVLDTSTMQAEANKVTQSFSNMASQAQIEGAKIDNAFSQVAGNIGKAFAALTAAATFQQLSQKILQVRGQFQQLEVAFETMIGSAEEADKLMSQLVQTAATTPFGLQDVASGAKQLLAYGVAADEVNDTLIRLGDIAAGLSIPLNDLVYLYGTTMTQGRLYTQDLRQFMGRGIPIVEELAKQFGVAKDAVGELVTAGKVGFPEVKKAIESLTDEGSKFGGLMEKQSHTISGQISNIEDALDMMFNDLGKQSEGVINSILSGVSYVIEHYQIFGKILLELVATYGAYKAALIAIAAINQAKILAENIRLVMMMKNEIGLATAAQQAFNITAKANPYGLLLAGITAVVGALILFVDHTDDATKAQERLNEVKTEAAAKVEEEKSKIELLIKAAKNEQLAMADRLNAVKKLNQIIPNYNAQLDATTGKYIENTNALNLYLKSLARKYELEGAKDRLKEIGKAIATARIDLRKANEEQKTAAAARNSTYNGAGAFIPTPIVGAKEVDDATSKINKANQNLKEAYKERDLIYKEYGVDLQKDAAKVTQTDVSASGTGGGKTNKRKKASGTTKTKSSGKTEDEPDLKQIQYNVDELTSEWNDALSELKDKIALDIVDASIELQEEGTERQLKKIKQGTKKMTDALDEEIKELQRKKLEEDKKIWLEQNPKKKEYDYVTPAEEGIDQFLAKYPELKALYETRKAQIEEAGKKATKKVRDEETREQKTATQEFLAQWGDYEAKKAAITADYEEQIKKATTPAEIANLRMQMDKELRELEKTNLEETIDWSGVFSELEGHTKEYLQGLAEQLQKVIKEGALPPDQLAVAQEKLRKINAEISKQNGLFAFVGDRQREHTRLIQAEADAREILEKRQEAEAEAEEALIAAQEAILGVDGDFGEIMEQVMTFVDTLGEDVDFGEISSKLDDTILQYFEKGTPEYKQMASLLETLRVSEAKLAQARKETKKATTDAKNAEDAAKRKSAQAVADWFADAQQFITQNSIDQIPDFLDSLGLGDASEKASKGLSAFNNAAGAAADFASGNYLGAAMKGFSAIMDFGSMLGIGGSSDKTLKKDIERLTYSNEALEGAVSRLAKTMEEQAGSDLAKTYQQAVDDLNQAMVNTKEMLARSGAAYNNGFLGIGGKGSSNYKIAKLLSTADWQRISQLMGKTITEVSQIWELSSEELGKLAESAPDIWAKIKQGAADGYQDITDYLDAYVEYYDKLIELQQQYNESLTQTSFDNIKSGLADLISDTETDAYDVINNVSDMMQKAILNIVLTKTMKPKLDKWYEDFANAMADDTLTAMENAALQQGYTDIYKQAKEEVDRAYKLAGIDPDRSDVEDASTGAWSALGEETGRSLDGRMTAIHIQVTRIADMMLINQEAIGRIDLRSMQDSTTLTEMQNLIFLSTGYLERMARNSDALPQINSKLELIRQNTDRL